MKAQNRIAKQNTRNWIGFVFNKFPLFFVSLLLFPFIYSRNVSTFFRSFRKTVVVSYVFHSNFALKIGEQPPRIDPLAQARCLIVVLFWSRFRRQREALWAKCAQISKLETLESLDLLIESYFTDCSFFKDHVINKIDFFFISFVLCFFRRFLLQVPTSLAQSMSETSHLWSQ